MTLERFYGYAMFFFKNVIIEALNCVVLLFGKFLISKKLSRGKNLNRKLK
jgi:hypothetical protein